MPSIRKPDSQKLPIPLNPVRQPVFRSLFVVAFGLLFFPAFQAFLSAFSPLDRYGSLPETIIAEVTWIGLGVFLLPTLVMSMLAR